MRFGRARRIRRRAGLGDRPFTGQGRQPTYRAADVVYLVDKLERGYDKAIYVLGADHHATAKWYGAIARMLGYDPDRIEVLLYQFVHSTSGGETSKASKRAGNVVFVDELMDEVGVDAARWYLVNRGPDQTIEVDVDLAAERSAKNPCTTSSTRMPASPRSCGAQAARLVVTHRPRSEERELIKRLTDFPVDGARGGRAARPAADPRVRDPARRRLPSLLPRVPRDRVARGGLPARPVPRDATRDRAVPRPRRVRSSLTRM